jgi:hypothetical protein
MQTQLVLEIPFLLKLWKLLSSIPVRYCDHNSSHIIQPLFRNIPWREGPRDGGQPSFMYAVGRGSRNWGEISLRASFQLAGVTAILQAQRNEVSPTARSGRQVTTRNRVYSRSTRPNTATLWKLQASSVVRR